MTEGPLQLRILRYTLLGPIDDARHILRRLQNNEAFQHYLRRRTLRALPLVVGILLTSLACSAAVVFLFFRAGILLVLAATIVVAPVVLIASFSVQAYVLLSWLEGRSLAKLQEHHRPRHRGPIGQWLVRSYRIDMGPLPQVPWIPALVFFLVPAAMLAQVAAPLAAGLAAFQIVAAIFYARRDPVHGIDHSPARGGVEALKSFAAAPLREVRAPKQAGDLDFASPAARSGTGSWTRRLRSFVQSGFRFLRFLVELCLLNLLPFVEYCVLVAGIFAIAQGRRSAAEQHVALGMLLVGVALLLAGLASIVTKRMSFRFYGSARTSYAGATALITGMMQVIVGGLAVATAHALATHVWQAKLDALLTNPWPLLIPLGLLLIGAGLLLVRRSSRYVGALGTVLFILPKTLTGVAALKVNAWSWPRLLVAAHLWPNGSSKFTSVGGTHVAVETCRCRVRGIVARRSRLGARRAAAARGKAGTGRHVFAEAGEDRPGAEEGGRRRILPRGGGDGGEEGEARLPGRGRHADRVGEDDARGDLPHLLDDQAAGVGGGDDAGRGRHDPAHRPGEQVPAGLRQAAGQRRDKERRGRDDLHAGAAGAADDGAGPAAPYVGPRLRRDHAERSGQGRIGTRRPLSPGPGLRCAQRHAGRGDRRDGEGAPGISARHHLELQRVDRHARPRGGEGLGQAPGGFPGRAPVQAARHEGFRLLGAGGQDAAPRRIAGEGPLRRPPVPAHRRLRAAEKRFGRRGRRVDRGGLPALLPDDDERRNTGRQARAEPHHRETDDFGPSRRRDDPGDGSGHAAPRQQGLRIRADRKSTRL